MDNIYVTLPPDLVAIQYPGYYFHVVEQRLYSLKSGELKQLYRHSGNHWNEHHAGYMVSHKGVRKFMREDFLIKDTNSPTLTIVPYHVPIIQQQQNFNRPGTHRYKRSEQIHQTF